jgi:hypothetical protein
MKHVSLRLPDDLHAALKIFAEADHRSLNSEIITLLERVIADRALRDSSTES